MISSRTPEGIPGRCPVCGRRVQVEPSSYPTPDACCPSCGSLLRARKPGTSAFGQPSAQGMLAAITAVAVGVAWIMGPRLGLYLADQMVLTLFWLVLFGPGSGRVCGWLAIRLAAFVRAWDGPGGWS